MISTKLGCTIGFFYRKIRETSPPRFQSNDVAAGNGLRIHRASNLAKLQWKDVLF